MLPLNIGQFWKGINPFIPPVGYMPLLVRVVESLEFGVTVMFTA